MRSSSASGPGAEELVRLAVLPQHVGARAGRLEVVDDEERVLREEGEGLVVVGQRPLHVPKLRRGPVVHAVPPLVHDHPSYARAPASADPSSIIVLNFFNARWWRASTVPIGSPSNDAMSAKLICPW